MILPGQLALFESEPVGVEYLDMKEGQLPGVGEVCRYGQRVLRGCLSRSGFPKEICEDIAQELNLWIIQAYPNFKPELNWQGYIGTRASGLVKDTMKLHRGFSREMKRQRLVDTDAGRDNDLDLILQLEGVSTESRETKRDIDFDLLARLAHSDVALHAFVRHAIFGQTINEIAIPFGVTPQMVDLYIKDFKSPFAHPDHKRWSSPEFLQALYALGISEHFEIRYRAYSDIERLQVGFCGPMVDFMSFDPPAKAKAAPEPANEDQAAFNFEDLSA